MGVCGRPLCCSTHLCDFCPVSIKMAKEQNLSLNPSKISGICGRLMCCLKYEEETYEDLNVRLPNVGDQVKTHEGLTGEVLNIYILRQKVKVVVKKEDGELEIREYKADDLKVIKSRKTVNKIQVSEEEKKELEALEQIEKQEGEMLKKLKKKNGQY